MTTPPTDPMARQMEREAARLEVANAAMQSLLNRTQEALIVVSIHEIKSWCDCVRCALYRDIESHHRRVVAEALGVPR